MQTLIDCQVVTVSAAVRLAATVQAMQLSHSTLSGAVPPLAPPYEATRPQRPLGYSSTTRSL
ncbi:hypothetical protein ACZ90_67420 [Streptomyces albus subsp. albus]|nr:hypothetical protein ACZ90_67420 [Streptomyces albus subsp. albus]